MIKELVCCVVDLEHWVFQIRRQMELLAPLPFLRRPLDRSLEVSVFKPFQALNKHAMAFILPYLVNSYFDQCQGNEDYTYVRNFAIRLSPHIFVRIEPNKFGQTDILDRFKSAIASWFEQYCSLHTAVYSLKDAFNPLFENLEFKMQLKQKQFSTSSNWGINM